MKKLIFTLIILTFTGVLYSQTVNFSWVEQGGSTFADIGTSVTVDGAGNVYSTGIFSSPTDRDIFVAKNDATGALLWSINIGGTGTDESRGVAVDGSGNVYITGFFESTVDFNPEAGTFNLTAVGRDIFVAKYNTSGALVWAKQMGGVGPDEAFSIAVDASGNNVYTTGYFTGPANFDPNGTLTLNGFGGLDIFVSNLDDLGNLVWAREMGGAGTDFGLSLTVDPGGDIANAGVFTGTADLDPVGTAATFISLGANDTYVSKITAAGGFVWAEQIGGGSNEQINSLAIDATGNIHATGFFDGTTDFDPGPGIATVTTSGGRDIFILKLNSSGDYVWVRSMGNPQNSADADRDIGLSIAVDGSSNVYTVGSFANTVDFDPSVGGSFPLVSAGERDAFLLILNSVGNFQLAGSAGDNDFDQAHGIALSSAGAIHMTGLFQNTVDFDPTAGTANLTSAGDADIFLLQLSQLISTPLTLIDFTAKLRTQTVELNWHTATEENTSHFEIEKSTNGTGFTKTGTLKAAGNSSTTRSYSFSDQQPSSGNNYYRLKMIDVDGKFTYSKVIVVRMDGKTSLQVFPNPAKNILFVQATGNDKNSLLRITDAAGKIVKEQRVALNGTTSFSIDITNLPRGLYYLTLKDATRIQRHKIIKQ